MEFTTVRELYRETDKHVGTHVRVAGWIRTIRDQKRFAFIELNDGSFFRNLQVVVEADAIGNYDEIARLGTGAALVCEGVVVPTPGARQPFEMKAAAIRVEGACPPDYPLQPKRHTTEYLRTISHLRPRTNLFSAVFRVRSVAAYSIHRFFNERNFIYLHSPIITASDAEGAGQMFSVTSLDLRDVPRLPGGEVDFTKDFFEKQARLTVSGQLSAETFAMAFSKVYTFGPTFRAERSNTVKHAAEFWMIEPEIAFSDLQDDMRLAEDMLRRVIRDVMESCPEEMEFFDRYVQPGLLERLSLVADSDFGFITYTDAVRELQKVRGRFEFPCDWGCDLQTEHERFLTEELFRKPVFVTGYPKDIKAFYMRLNDDGKTVAAMDCLVPGIGEIIGGSQREERLSVLEERIASLGMRPEDYWWYLDLRRYGGTRHAGYGLGFDRMIMYLTGVANIRDVLPYPRTTGYAEF